jgi:hypothetical protein
VTAAIIFEPGVDESEAEAARLEHAVGAGLPVGKTVIHVRRVSATDLAGLAGVKLAFVTTGVRHQQDVAAAAARQSIVTVTPDMSCVQAARCVVGISSGSPLQIVVSRAAARAASIRFGSAFLMLVKEI